MNFSEYDYESMTDCSLMPYGKYEGTKMCNVPANYLIWLHENDRCSEQVRDYIDSNLSDLKQEAKNQS